MKREPECTLCLAELFTYTCSHRLTILRQRPRLAVVAPSVSSSLCRAFVYQGLLAFFFFLSSDVSPRLLLWHERQTTVMLLLFCRCYCSNCCCCGRCRCGRWDWLCILVICIFDSSKYIQPLRNRVPYPSDHRKLESVTLQQQHDTRRWFQWSISCRRDIHLAYREIWCSKKSLTG